MKKMSERVCDELVEGSKYRNDGKREKVRERVLEREWEEIGVLGK